MKKIFVSLFIICGCLLCTNAYAIKSSEVGLYVKRNDSYTKDGKYAMSFKMTNNSSNNEYYVEPYVINSSGKKVFTWKGTKLNKNDVLNKNYLAKYSKLPSGKYTFVLNLISGYTAEYAGPYRKFTWKYTVNHNASKLSFGSTNYKYDTNGNKAIVFNVDYSNLKGKKGTIEIYNEYSELVYKHTGSARNTNKETGWFKWNFYPSKGGLKCESGNYTVKISCDGAAPIQKNYYLNI